MIMRELKPLPVFRNDGVQRAAPAPADDFRRIDRVRTAAHGPENIVDIIDIDIVVRDDDVAAEMGGALALTGDKCSLARMTGVALLDRDDG